MSSMNPKDIYERERAERLSNVAPRRDADNVSEADLWSGEPQDRDAKRVRDHKVQQFRSWYVRAHGSQPSDEQVREYLGEGGMA